MMADQLPATHSLLEIVVMVGVDANTGLVPAQLQPPLDEIESDNPLFCTAMEPQVLAAVSANVAFFPSSNPNQDDNYPPSAAACRSMPKRANAIISKHWSPMKSRNVEPNNNTTSEAKSQGIGMKRGINRSKSFRASDFAKKQSSHADVMLQPAELPVGMDMLNSLVTLCFPDGLVVSSSPRDIHVHHLILTDIKGSHSYATCLTYYKPHLVYKEKVGGGWRCEPCGSVGGRRKNARDQQAYIPVCLTAISRHSLLTTLTDCLSGLCSRLQEDADHWRHLLKEFALQLTRTVVPPAANLIVEMQLGVLLIPIPCPSEPGQPVADFDLTVPLRCMGVDYVLLLVSALLTQQRLIFVSAHYATLVIALESLLHYILPFKWHFPYVPVLGWNLLDMLDAPGTFIMGCHAKHRSIIDKVEGLVVVDLDLGEVQACSSLNIPSMPQGALQIFKLAVRKMLRHFEWNGLGRPCPLDYADMRKKELDCRMKVNSAIKLACLELMANMFRDVLFHVKMERRFFHKEQFLQSIDELDKNFYVQVLNTDLFSEFLKERMCQLTPDYWTEFVEKNKPYNRNSLGPQILEGMMPAGKAVLPRCHSLSLMVQHTSAALTLVLPHGAPTSPNMSLTHTWLRLPKFIYVLCSTYLTRCSEEVTKSMQEDQSNGASLVYLKGVLQASTGQMEQALEEFHKLEALSAKLFPINYVCELLTRLNPVAREKLENTAHLSKSPLFRQSYTQHRSSAPDMPVIMELNKIPETDIDADGFAALVQMLDVTADHDTIRRLHGALTLKKCSMVDPVTFEEFYKCWKENELELQQAAVPETILDRNEYPLKLSNVCKCTFGTGRLVVTQKRVLFLYEGSTKCKEVIHLRNIRTIEKLQQRSIFNPVPALKIHAIDEKLKPFNVLLKEHCELWILLLGELWAGKLLAEQLCDPSIIQQASQNALLLNAYITSGESGICTHSGQELNGATDLCYFTHQREEGATEVPADTRDVLQHRFDPSAHEQERCAVETMLYTPGKRCDGDDRGPKLWCGLANGKVRAYDASTWRAEPQAVQASDRVVCLACVCSGSQVWAGSFDSKIYVIDVDTNCCNRMLTAHTDMLADFTLAPDGSLYSVSLNGQIVKWDPSTVRRTEELCLRDVTVRSLHATQSYLWCCTRESLLVLNLDGTIAQHIEHHSNPEDPPDQLGCFLLTDAHQVWVGCSKRGEVVLYDTDTLSLIFTITLECRGVSKMIQVNNKVWVGTKEGQVFVCSIVPAAVEKCLHAHDDSVRAMCSALNRYVFTGAGSRDGKIAIWKTSSPKAVIV